MRRSSASILALTLRLAAQGDAPPGEFVVPPRTVEFGPACRELFDPAQGLPWPARDDARSLRGRIERLLERRWPVAADETACATFGDLLGAAVALRGRPRALELLLQRIEERRPEISAEVGDLLADLGRDSRFRSQAWRTGQEVWDDGFHFGPPLTLGEAPMPAFGEVSGSRVVQQAATLILADLCAIEEAENDYRGYRDHVDAAYEQIFPVPGSHLRGSRDGRPFAGLRLFFESDLPFPFTGYACDLRVFKQLDAAGHLVTDTWSDSPDFHWIAGSSVYLPVRRSDGSLVGMIAVRIFGFDLRGVPDGDADRRAGLRAVLGNLKRGAEERFAARDPGRDLVFAGAIPEVPVRGRR
jgi:hypothetical protein